MEISTYERLQDIELLFGSFAWIVLIESVLDNLLHRRFQIVRFILLYEGVYSNSNLQYQQGQQYNCKLKKDTILCKKSLKF